MKNQRMKLYTSFNIYYGYIYETQEIISYEKEKSVNEIINTLKVEGWVLSSIKKDFVGDTVYYFSKQNN